MRLCQTEEGKTMQTINEVGNRYERLRVIELYDPTKHGFFKRPSTNAYWVCECECGATTIVSAASLRSGQTKSCGCLRRETSRAHAKALHDRDYGERKMK